MADLTPIQRFLLLTAAMVAVTVAVMLAWPDSDEAGVAPDRHPTGGARPVIDQAKWKITSIAAGKAARRRGPAGSLRSRRKELRKLVVDVYDALFLHPSELGTATRRYFAPPAGRALRETRAGMPRGTREIKTLRRHAVVAIDRSSRARATAEITVIAKGARVGRVVRVRHTGHLWLERSGHAWSVLAYQIDQRPVPSRRSSVG